MSHSFTSKGSGPMKPGATVEWEFADVGKRLAVEVKEVEENRKVTFDWTAGGVKARVTLVLESDDSGTTLVTINETGWPMDTDGVRRPLGPNCGMDRLPLLHESVPAAQHQPSAWPDQERSLTHGRGSIARRHT